MADNPPAEKQQAAPVADEPSPSAQSDASSQAGSPDVIGEALWYRQRTEWLTRGKVAKAEKGIYTRNATLTFAELSNSEQAALTRCLEETQGPYPALKRPLPLRIAISCATRIWNDEGPRWTDSVSSWFSSSVVDPVKGALQSVGLADALSPTSASPKGAGGHNRMSTSSPYNMSSQDSGSAMRNALRMRGGIALNQQGSASAPAASVPVIGGGAYAARQVDEKSPAAVENEKKKKKASREGEEGGSAQEAVSQGDGASLSALSTSASPEEAPKT